MSDGVSESALSSPHMFEPRPYRPDGGFSFSGLAILTFITCLAGAVIGVIGGVIAQFFFLIILFPLVMGVVIGAAGAFGVKTGRVRMPIVCGTAGLLGGCVAAAAMHGFAYYQFENELKEVPPEVRLLARNLEKLRPKLKELPPEVQDIINKLSQDDQSRRALAVDGLLSYIDLMAHQGVEIGGRRGRNPMNLGYVGSYCYWGFELFLIAGVAFGLMNATAAEPYCARCDNWKKSEPVGAFPGDAKSVQIAVENGDLAAIPNHVTPTGDQLTASVFTCPQCEKQSEIDVRIDKVTTNSKGEESTSTLCTVTYPGEALESVREVFGSALSGAQKFFTPPAEDAPAADSTDNVDQQNP